MPRLRLLQAPCELHCRPGRRRTVHRGEEGCLSLPVRRGLLVRQCLQVPRLHLLPAQGLLRQVPGQHLQL
ncbi:MAG: hypothetical protein GX575_05880 [Candidatus Anammoximicrobium sp.]|nr:hypothetical protein [Candidatus Anammoximicrobium sp.]